MKKSSFIVVMSLFVLSIFLATSSYAREVNIGVNKGKEIKSQIDYMNENTETLNKSLQEILKSQMETQKILEKLILSIQAQEKNSAEMLKIMSENKKIQDKEKLPVQAKKMEASEEEPSANMVELQRSTNELIKELIEEQKWLGAIIQGFIQKSANVGKSAN